LALTITQLAASDEFIRSLLDQTLQIAGSQVE
jgi:hypothetical protein